MDHKPSQRNLPNSAARSYPKRKNDDVHASEVELSDLFLFRFQKTLKHGKLEDAMSQKQKSMNRTKKFYDANAIVLVLSASPSLQMICF